MYTQTIPAETLPTQCAKQIPRHAGGRRFVIGDIHGCFQTMIALIKSLELRPEDQLFFLGDYIDRGPHSRKVLDYLIALTAQNPNVHCLRGNHEQMVLEYALAEDPVLLDYLEQYASEDLWDPRTQSIPKKYLEFFRNLPFYIQTDGFLLVHAGLDFSKPNPFEGYFQMIWIRNMRYNAAKQSQLLGNLKIVHGHTPVPVHITQQMIDTNHFAINLDNGCVFRNYHPDLGSLLGLNLDSLEVISVPYQ